MMIKELLDAKAASADVVLTDTELQSKYMDHLFEIMVDDSILRCRLSIRKDIINVRTVAFASRTMGSSLSQIVVGISECVWIPSTSVR